MSGNALNMKKIGQNSYPDEDQGESQMRNHALLLGREYERKRRKGGHGNNADVEG